MKLQLDDLYYIFSTFSIKDSFIKATDQVPLHHILWVTDNLVAAIVQRCLYNAVIELNDQHILIVVAQLVSDKLHILNFIGTKAPTEPIYIR